MRVRVQNSWLAVAGGGVMALVFVGSQYSRTHMPPYTQNNVASSQSKAKPLPVFKNIQEMTEEYANLEGEIKDIFGGADRDINNMIIPDPNYVTDKDYPRLHELTSTLISKMEQHRAFLFPSDGDSASIVKEERYDEILRQLENIKNQAKKHLNRRTKPSAPSNEQHQFNLV